MIGRSCGRRSKVAAKPSDLRFHSAGAERNSFTFITRPLCLQVFRRKRVSAAPFRSRNYWTPRSVFRDGSNSEGSPSAPLSRVGYWIIAPLCFGCLHRLLTRQAQKKRLAVSRAAATHESRRGNKEAGPRGVTPSAKQPPPTAFVFLPPTSNGQPHRPAGHTNGAPAKRRPPFPARSYGAPQFVRARLSIGFLCLCSADLIGGCNTPSPPTPSVKKEGRRPSAPCPQTRLLTRGETRAGLRRALV